jgi:hypothetical protein
MVRRGDHSTLPVKGGGAMIDEYGDGFVEGSPPAPGGARMPSDIQPITPVNHSSAEPLFGVPESWPVVEHSFPAVPPVRLQQALYQSVSSRPKPAQGVRPTDDQVHRTHAVPAGSVDGPTNIYYLAAYQYQVTLSAVSMGDHELGLLLPCSGRIWLNSRLFNDVPRGRELATRDAWWRVIDTSPAVRFLLAWSISFYRIARFQGVAHEQLPNWTRELCFRPTVRGFSRRSVQLQSDVLCDLTELFAPRARISRQLEAILPVSRGHQSAGRVSRQSGRIPQDGELLRYLADQNNCPATLVQRSLDGNRPLLTFEDYVDFTESILRDIPRLQMQRTVAMRHKPPVQRRVPTGPLDEPVSVDFSGLSQMPDPRRHAAFWKLHL